MLRIDSWRAWGPVAAVLVTGCGVPLSTAPAPQKASSSDPLTIPRNRITHYSLVESVSWSPDGKTLAPASLDGAVKLWDVSPADASK
jgi:WD40 repeat protein